MMTLADVLEDIKLQLSNAYCEHVVLSREAAEYLHEHVIAIIVERDELVFERDRI